MADRKPNDVMLGTATGLTGYEIWLLRRNPAGVDSITADNFFGPNADQAATGNHTHTLATTTTPGFMSTGDKAKVDVFDQTKMVSSGGTAGQVLTKLSATNFHFAWANPPAGGGGTSTGWAQYSTAAALATANPTMAVGTSGYETDTLRWKLGNGTGAWNTLPYQDTALTPAVITNPGSSVGFNFRPLTTQIINYTSVALGATLNSTINVPSAAPPTAHEGTMFIRVTNNSAGTVNVLIPGYNLVGDFFDGSLAPTEAIEFSVWVLHGIWYAEGSNNIPAGSITNAHLTNMASGTIKGRWTAGTGTPEDLNGAQLRAIVDFAQPNVVTIGSDTTLVRSSHQGKVLVCTAAVSLTVTTSTDFDAHTSTLIRAQGGAVTIVNSTTVNAPSGLIIPQFNLGTLARETTADVYTLTYEGTAGEGGSVTIADGSITNAKLANVSSGTFKGRLTAGAGAPEDIAATDVRASLDVLPPPVVTIGSSTTLTKAAHQGRELVCTAAISLTVDTATDFDAHGYCWIKAEGGAVTVVASAPVNSVSGLVIPRYSSGKLARATAADSYTLSFFAAPTSAGTGSGTYVDNHAALRAIGSPSVGQVVNVRGHSTAGDGGGGAYLWDSTSTATTNGGTVLDRNTGGTGRWLLQWQDFVNVKVFGCKGDNSTNDQPALQLAVNAKVPLYLPKGTYLLNAPITWDHRDRPLIMQGQYGRGYGGTQLSDNRGGTPEEPLFHQKDRWMIEDGSWVNTVPGDPWVTLGYAQIFKDIMFTANKGRLGHAVCLGGGKGTTIERCYFQASYRGLTMDKTCFDASVKDCYFEGTTRTHYPWDGTTNAVSNKTVTKLAWALYICSHKFVTGIYVKGFGTAIHAVGAGVTVVGGRFEENYYGMTLGGMQYELSGGPGGVSSWPLERSFFTGFSVEANTIGIRINDFKSSTLESFGIQGSPAAGNRPTSEIGLRIESMQNTATVRNGICSGTFTHGGIVNETRLLFDQVTASGSVVSYAKANSPFTTSGGGASPFFRTIGYRAGSGQTLTAFSDLQLQGIAGLNIRDGLVRPKNLGDVAIPTTGATSVAVAFSPLRDKNTYAFNAVTTPTTTSTLSAGTYYYATTVLAKHAETGINYNNSNANGYRTVVVASGQGVQMTFLGGTVSSLKRRIYRTKVNADAGNFEGFWEQDSTSATFTDTGQAFTARGMPPIDGNIGSCEEEDTNYEIVATPSWATTVHVTDKATTGFTLNFGTAAPAGGTCAWLMFRP